MPAAHVESLAELMSEPTAIETRRRPVEEVERRVAAFFSEGQLSLPAQVLIVTGKRPGSFIG